MMIYIILFVVNCCGVNKLIGWLVFFFIIKFVKIFFIMFVNLKLCSENLVVIVIWGYLGCSEMIKCLSGVLVYMYVFFCKNWLLSCGIFWVR